MKILVMGACGYLGNTLYKKLKKINNNEVLGTCFKHTNSELLKIDVLNINDLDKIRLLEPDVIIWSIMDKERENQFSEVSLKYIMNYIPGCTRFVYVSTTVGMGKNQTEDVVPYKRNINEYLYKYINGKIDGESIINKHRNHVIIRPGSIYGYDYDCKMDCRMKELLTIAKRGQKYYRTANMYSSYVNVMDLADAIIELIDNDFKGIINISGEIPISYYDFYVYLLDLCIYLRRFTIGL